MSKISRLTYDRLREHRKYVSSEPRANRPRCADIQPEQFVEYYYKTFDADRSQLAPLYGDQSMLTFEASAHQGTASIVEKLQVRINYPFLRQAWMKGEREH